MFRWLSILIMVAGVAIMAKNLIPWWEQRQLAVQSTTVANEAVPDWKSRTVMPIVPQGNPITNPNYKLGQDIGTLYIPQLGYQLPIVEGADANSLSKGVGHYVGYGTVYPGENGHLVLSGHRDTVFRGLGNLKAGDKVLVQYQGYIYVYQIRKYWITDANDRTVIVPMDQPVLTLTTCYPFDYIGDAPDRYIIQADLVESKKYDPKVTPNAS